VYGITGKHGIDDGPPTKWSQFNPRTSNTLELRIASGGQEVSLGTKTIGPCTETSCKTSTFPTSMEVGQSQSFTVAIGIGVGWGPPYSAPTDPRMNIVLSGPAGFNQTMNGVPYKVSGSGTNTQLTTDPAISFTPAVPGEYHVAWSLSGSISYSCGYGAASGTPNTGTAGFLPYFSVQGGDITAGAGYCGLSGNDPTADIAAFNAGPGDPTPFAGAGTQVAARALRDILSFASSTNLGGSDAGSQSGGKGLAFANTTAQPNANPYKYIYGGSLGSLPCVPDYAKNALASATQIPNTVNPASLASGTYYVNGNTQINPAVLSRGQNVTIVVKGGNAIITGPITYDPYGSVAEIPQFRLIVQGGNLLIDHSVTELHGAYIAEPAGNDNSTGIIATCARNNSESSDYDICTNPLTVYGALSAAAIHFDRTYGSVHSSTAGGVNTPAEPAERIIFTPELWLANPPAAADGSTTPDTYNSITGLPPIL
jgi:hypothetical protein